MFFPALILALIVGRLRGGSLASLLEARVHWGWLIPAAFGIRFVLYLGLVALPLQWVAVSQALAYGAVLVTAWLNRSLPGFPTLLLGAAANALVIMANGGRMPVSPQALVVSGQEELIARLGAEGMHTHQLLDASTRLPWLADILALPAWWPLATAFSIGDVLIALGVFAYVQWQMGAGRRPGSVLQ